MKKQIQELFRDYIFGVITEIQLIGLLNQYRDKNIMFRFGNDSTILYTIGDIEKDLINSTFTNKLFLIEQMKESLNNDSIQIME